MNDSSAIQLMRQRHFVTVRRKNAAEERINAYESGKITIKSFRRICYD